MLLLKVWKYFHREAHWIKIYAIYFKWKSVIILVVHKWHFFKRINEKFPKHFKLISFSSGHFNKENAKQIYSINHTAINEKIFFAKPCKYFHWKNTSHTYVHTCFCTHFVLNLLLSWVCYLTLVEVTDFS